MAKKSTPPKPKPVTTVRSTYVPTRVPGAYIGAAGVAGGLMPSVSSPYRGAAGVAGVPRALPIPPKPLTTAQIYGQNAAGMRAAGARGVGAVVPPRPPARTTNPVNPMFRGNMASPDTLERQGIVAAATQAGVRAPTLEDIVANAQRRAGITPAGSTPRPTSGGSGGGLGSGGGGGIGAGSGGGGGDFGGGMGSILDAIRGGFAGQRSAVDEQLAAALGAQTGRRTAAGAARDEATAQLGRIVDDLISGAGAAGQRVGDVYSGGVSQIGQLMRDYEAMAGQRAAAGGRTLSAFGADASMAQPGGMGAADYLAAEAGALTGAGTVEGAYWGARPQAYQGLRSDIDTQRALAYEQLMGQIANQEQQLTAEAAGRRAQLTTEEEQAILGAQMQQWELQQQLAARRGAAGGGGGDDFSFLPIPAAYGGV